MKIAIAGAGIGGLTAALCLAKSGHDIELFEQADRFVDVGAGIQCGANAMHVFDYLGLSPELAERAVRPSGIHFRDYCSGGRLHTIELGDAYTQKYDAPYLHIHRADLHALLLRAFKLQSRNKLHMGCRVESFDEGESAVDVYFDNQTYLSADCLIAADGVHSKIRTQIAGDFAPRFTGNVAWRGVVSVADLPIDWMETVASNFVGPKKHMVLYYLRNRTLANFVGVVENKTWRDDSWVAKASWEELSNDFAGWHPCVQSIIDAVDKEQCYRWALYDHRPLRNWSSKRVALLGDAAHATLPFMASGAAMAIEDARILQRSLNESTALSEGLILYQNSRINRTTQVQRDSARAGSLYHFNSSFMRKAAFTGLKFAGGSKQDFLPNYNANTVRLG